MKKLSQKKSARRALTIAAKQERQHKSFLYIQKIWRDSLFHLNDQLRLHCVSSKSDKLRFQNGRLIHTLRDRIEAAGKTPLSETQLGCYVLMTTESLQLGYDEPRRLHLEELKARSATGLGKCNVGFLLNSIASWVEAQESFDFWLAATQHDPYWQSDDPVERTRAFAASYLSYYPELISQYEGVRIGSQSMPLALAMKSEGVTWTRSEWAAILKWAAAIATKPKISCAESDRWTWWCYPVFRRYGWSAREVQQAACERGYTTDTRGKNERDFRRYWIARGLRFAGKRTNRRSAPLSDFVKGISVPRKLSFGVQIWG